MESYQPDSKIIIRCLHCKERMRVPLNKGKIRVICPTCRKDFIYDPNSILHTLKQIMSSAVSSASNLLHRLGKGYKR